MIDQIQGLHHVTSMAKDAALNNRFFTHTLGLRRVKKTVNFDAPDVYHLYYADRTGTPGSVITYFPFPDIAPRRPGSGEVGSVAFAVPIGSLSFWRARLETAGVVGVETERRFDQHRLVFTGPDDEDLALVEQGDDARLPWTGGGVGADHAIRGFHAVTMRLADGGATRELLAFMGYAESAGEDNFTRLELARGKGAGIIDIQSAPDLPAARMGAGTVHHVAFSVADRAAQLAVRKVLADAGQAVTPVIDRDYFYAIYFRSPEGVLFEVATNEPGFARDEEEAHLGEGLMLPRQHEHLRARLETRLQPLEA